MAIKVREKAWSVAADKIREKLRPNMPADQKAVIEQQAQEQALSDTYGASWRERLQPDGTIAENGIGSPWWLVNVATDGQAERHFAAVEKYIGPAAAKSEREKIARMKASKR
jgi:hypothetical protein